MSFSVSVVHLAASSNTMGTGQNYLPSQHCGPSCSFHKQIRRKKGQKRFPAASNTGCQNRRNKRKRKKDPEGKKKKKKRPIHSTTVVHLAASATRAGTVTVISVNKDEDISLPSLWQGKIMTTAHNRQWTEPTCTAHTEATSKREQHMDRNEKRMCLATGSSVTP